MALVGTFIKYWQEPSEDEFYEVEVTYPEVMSEDDPNYGKDGQTETIQEPVLINRETALENVYVVIRSYAITKNEAENFDLDGERLGLFKRWYLNLRATVYESEEAKYNDPENYLTEENVSIPITTLTGDLFELGYSKLKSEKGFEQLTDKI